MNERASGWYPDPDDPDTLRYWDGILWTDRTMPRVKPGLDRSHLGDAPNVPDHDPSRQYQPHPGHGSHGRMPHPGVQQLATKPAVSTTPDGQELAAWWRRALALVLDNLITFAIAVPLSWTWLSPWFTVYRDYVSDTVDAATTGGEAPTAPEGLFDFPWQVAGVVVAVYFVYEVGLTVWRGQTLGKMATGIKVRRIADERPPTLGTAAYRFVIKQVSTIAGLLPVVSFVGTIFQIVDYLRPLSDRMNQSFHDSWPGTYVVRAKSPAQHLGNHVTIPGPDERR